MAQSIYLGHKNVRLKRQTAQIERLIQCVDQTLARRHLMVREGRVLVGSRHGIGRLAGAAREVLEVTYFGSEILRRRNSDGA